MAKSAVIDVRGISRPGSIPHSTRPGSLSSKTQGLGIGLAPQRPTGSGGGSLRSIGHNFKVNASNGTMALSIPIHTSPGRSDFGPELSLSYDSGSGNGSFGLGWSISMPSISRKTSKCIPSYTDNDVFVFTGVEDLVPCHDHDQTKTEISDKTYLVNRYRPRVEVDQSRIERWSQLGDPGDVFWKVVSSQNITSIFGESDASRTFHTDEVGCKRIFAWQISSMYDHRGNEIQYRYKAEDGAGIASCQGPLAQCERHRSTRTRSSKIYLKSIVYGNRAPNRDVETWEVLRGPQDWLFEVVLDYGEHDEEVPSTTEIREWKLRADPFSTYKSGFEIRNYRICQRILMFHHIPEKLSLQDYLVSSVLFQYHESPSGTTLASSIQCGHLWNGQKYRTQQRPPAEYKYSELADPSEVRLETIDTSSIQSLPGDPGTKTEWIDLDGDGVAGILQSLPGNCWMYQRNESAVTSDDASAEFGHAQQLPKGPPAAQGGQAYFEDLEKTGALDLVRLDADGRLNGYQSRRDSGWLEHKTFPSIPNLSLSQNHLIRIDLTGNGLQDVMAQDATSNELVWYECLGTRGFGPQKRVAYSDDGPNLIATEPESKIHLADMSGDGLLDIVLISNGAVSYWPNFGNGAFGRRVEMGNSPIMDDIATFTQERVKLADIDGSGAADMIYLPRDGGLRVFCNCSGNSWGDARAIDNFPVIDNLSSVFTADILGRGTSYLCWKGPDTSAQSRSKLQFLDFNNRSKSHLLISYTNGIGLTTNIQYKPSTWYSKKDERDGVPWRTKLPFPVYCVSQTTAIDEISKTTLSQRYVYHEGHYDGHEREFRGFGMVEQWDAAKHASGVGDVIHAPATHTKSWFSIGAQLTIAQAFDRAYLEGPEMPKTLTVEEYRDACRALKGHCVRIEVYCDDGTPKQGIPYTVKETRYAVQKLQSTLGLDGHAVFRTDTIETLHRILEREPCNPRIEHNLILDLNQFGDVTRQVTVHYGREKQSLGAYEEDEVQFETIVRYHETNYTNSIDDRQTFLRPQLAEEKSFRVLGWPNKREGGEVFTTADFNRVSTLEVTETEKTDKNRGQPQRLIVDSSRVYYRSNDMLRMLPLGTIDTLSVLFCSYKLAHLPSLMAEVYGSTKSLHDKNIKLLIPTSGYVELDGDGALWEPAGRSRFSTDVAQELKCARSSFFTATVMEDPMGNISLAEFDEFNLFAVRTVNPLKQATATITDYASLQATQVTDVNGNRNSTAYGVFGEVTGSATMGKPTELLGDDLTGFDPLVSVATAEEFMRNPTGAVAQSLLGSASTRHFYNFAMYNESRTSKKVTPPFKVSLSRETHAHEVATPGRVLITITYLDGYGEDLQAASFAGTMDEPLKWRFSGWHIKDGKRRSVVEYQPYFATTHQYRFGPQSNVLKTLVFDGCDRLIGRLNADHTWEKTCFSSWTTNYFDRGDTVLIKDMTKDPDLGHYFASIPNLDGQNTWYAQRTGGQNSTRWDADAATKSTIYHDKPTLVLFDAMGREVLRVLDEGTFRVPLRTAYDLRDNRCAEYDGLKRLVCLYQYDLLRRMISVAGMDTAPIRTLHICGGRPALIMKGGQNSERIVYDTLNRACEHWTAEDGGNEALTTRIVYGEITKDAASRNLNGNVLHVYDQSGMTTKELFDFKGNCTQQVVKLAVEYKDVLDWQHETVDLEPELYNTSSVYDGLNREIESTDALGAVTRRYYDPLGHVQSVSWKSNKECDWIIYMSYATYTADGKPLRIAYGNESSTDYTYDPVSRVLTRQRTSRRDGSSVLQDIAYTEDCCERITHTADESQAPVFFQNSKVDPDRNFKYDALGRLVKAEGREQVDPSSNSLRSSVGYKSAMGSVLGSSIPQDGSQVARYNEVYEYDIAGNLTRMNHEAVTSQSGTSWTRNYSYDVPSRLVKEERSNRLSRTSIKDVSEEYLYEGRAGDRGCMTSISGYSRLTWNKDELLRSSSTQVYKEGVPETTWYVYNSSGTRVRKVTERATTDGSPVRKLKETRNLFSAEIHMTFKGDGKNIMTSKSTSEINSDRLIALHEAHLLATGERKTFTRFQEGRHLELDEQGQVLSYEEYSPFGATTFSACSSSIEVSNRNRYSRYNRDTETGLYLSHARYFAPWIGRWISADPAGTIDGPNVYSYVANDPINMVDPSGTCRIEGGIKNEIKGSKDTQSSSNTTLLPTLPGTARAGSNTQLAPLTTKSAYFTLKQLSEARNVANDGSTHKSPKEPNTMSAEKILQRWTSGLQKPQPEKPIDPNQKHYDVLLGPNQNKNKLRTKLEAINEAGRILINEPIHKAGTRTFKIGALGQFNPGPTIPNYEHMEKRQAAQALLSHMDQDKLNWIRHNKNPHLEGQDALDEGHEKRNMLFKMENTKSARVWKEYNSQLKKEDQYKGVQYYFKYAGKLGEEGVHKTKNLLPDS